MSSSFWLWPSTLFIPLYAIFCVVLLVVWRRTVARRAMQQDRFEPLPTALLQDPYVFAYLRGGRREAIRLAVFALLTRGALRFTGTSLVRHKWPGTIDSPLEKLVFDQLASSLMPSVLVRHHVLGMGVDALYQPQLTRSGLLTASRLYPGYYVVVAVVWVLAIARWVWAPEGVGGAIDALVGIIAVVFTVTARWRRSPVTPLGRALVNDRRTQFATHQAMAIPKAHRTSAAYADQALPHARGLDVNVLWLGAVMGLTALPASATTVMSKVFPVAQGGMGGGSDGSWNSGGADSGGGSFGDGCSSSDGGSCDSGGSSGDSGGGGDGGGGGGGD